MDQDKEQDKQGMTSQIRPVAGLYEDWFLDYASYVILDRAVPHIHDGLKPVQRRILHSMQELEDGRYNKVANLIGHTMKYHPHGDASIGDALVQLGQKDLLIDTQGNWGNILTGDSAAAPRYIEARLSKLALDILFNPETTEWQSSYDGRNKEPLTLPVKFPLLLAIGVEGIAVGLSTRILPHNFLELIDASIAHLQGRKFQLFPDFPTAGYADVSRYEGGARGGKVRIRARIEILDKKTLRISEIPYGTNTSGLIDSIVAANDKGKIKVKKIEDNTAADVEILLHLPPGISPDVTVDALYAFTSCEVSISPNACVIDGERPAFLDVQEILRRSTDRTKELLGRELEIKKAQLLEKHLFSSLEKIFIQERIYRRIEECETWEAVLQAIDKGLDPFKKQFYRAITEEDLVRLTEIKIKRISKYDSFRAEELLLKLLEEIKETEHHLAHLTEYAIAWFKDLKSKYGKGRERKTELREFDAVTAQQVALANEKLYMDRAGGFIGTGLKKEEFVADCSDLDDIIVFRDDGSFRVVKVAEKTFVGKGIIWAGVWKKGDERTVYHMIYKDGKTGISYMKRFHVTGVTRDKEYDLTAGNPNSAVLWFSHNPNGEAEKVRVLLRPMKRLRKTELDLDFAHLAIKGRSSKGNVVTRYPVKKIELLQKGGSTLGGIRIWFDPASYKLNTEERGNFLGEFAGEDRILVAQEDGCLLLKTFDLNHHFDHNPSYIGKYHPSKALTAVYYDGERKSHFVKRFVPELSAVDRKVFIISEHKESRLLILSAASDCLVRVKTKKGKSGTPDSQDLLASSLVDVRGWKSIGNKLSRHQVQSVQLLEEILEQKPKEESAKKEVDSRSPALEINNPDDLEVIQDGLEQPSHEDKKDNNASTSSGGGQATLF